MKSLFLRLISIFIVILILIQIVKNINVGDAQTIAAPRNHANPIRGEWIVDNYKMITSEIEDKNSIEKWIGKSAYLSEDIAVLGDETCSLPQYKVKTMDAGSFLLNTYNLTTAELGIENRELDIISVASSDKHFYDFILVDNDNMAVYFDNVILFFKKVSNSIKSSVVAEKVENEKLEQSTIKAPEAQILRSGVLLGLRSINESYKGIMDMDRFSYRTIWISSKNRILYPATETTGLLVPRDNGFWKVELKSQYKDDFLKESIFAYPIETPVSRGLDVRKVSETEKFTTNILKNILFVGNDYISIEYGEGIEASAIELDRLQVVPIDRPENSNKMKISDIEGDGGKTALISSAKAHLTTNHNIKSELIEKEAREDNFKIVRRNGHWILNGRLDYLNPIDNNRFEDFAINLTPSEKIVNYDKLSVSWNAIKERAPNAIDAYTSPNIDIAIVICKDSINIYSIKNTILSPKPLEKVQIKEGESVVMAEWATGDYVERWTKTMALDSSLSKY